LTSFTEQQSGNSAPTKHDVVPVEVLPNISGDKTTETVSLQTLNGLVHNKHSASNVGLLSKISSRIDKMKGLGIFDDEQADSLKQNMGAQASEDIYLTRQFDLLGILTYLADYAKQNNKSFGPGEVRLLITDQGMIDDQINRGVVDGKHSTALKEKQLATLDRLAVVKFTREFLKQPNMGLGAFQSISTKGGEILENTQN